MTIGPAADVGSEYRWEAPSRRRELRRWIALIGGVWLPVLILLALAFGGLFANVLATHDPGAVDVLHRLLAPGPTAMESGHLLGTDALGRDVFSRILFGSRSSLVVAISVLALGGIVGTCAGLFAGYSGGRIDQLVMALIDVEASFPGILLALLILSAIGPGVGSVVIVLAATQWMVYARVVRAQVLSIREQQFVESSIAIGCSTARILLSHVLPNLAGPLMVVAALETGSVILNEAVLSFLGIGVQPPATSWGLMLADGQAYVTVDPSLVLVPGIAIACAVVSVNLLAVWLGTGRDKPGHWPSESSRAPSLQAIDPLLGQDGSAR